MKKIVTIKFLGTSSAENIPRDDECLQCVSTDKKDKRLCSAILVGGKILVDAGPDILKQLTIAKINQLEAVLITHDHHDHIAGIKDLLRARRNIRIIKLKAGDHFKLLNIDFHAFKVRHSNLVPTVGIEIDDAVYIPDYADLDYAQKYLVDAKIAILDGSVFGKNFGGHLSINETIAVTKQMKNLKNIYFTHNGHSHKTHKEMEEIVKKLGDNRYHLAYDGLDLEI